MVLVWCWCGVGIVVASSGGAKLGMVESLSMRPAGRWMAYRGFASSVILREHQRQKNLGSGLTCYRTHVALDPSTRQRLAQDDIEVANRLGLGAYRSLAAAGAR